MKTQQKANLQRYGGILIIMSLIMVFGFKIATAEITEQMDINDRGPQVSELQRYLGTNLNIYPENLITGYFGNLTEAAVKRFQTTQGIISSGTPASTGYGRVGPQTMIRINSLISNSNPINSNDISPTLSNSSVQYTNTTATFTWNTDMPTTGQIYWSKNPLEFNEMTAPKQLPYVSGTLALDAGGLQTSHSVTVSNLEANTTYYFMMRAIDVNGNMSMLWPSSFRTNQ